MTEYGYRVAPRSTRDIAEVAEALLRVVAPGHLDGGSALDLASLADGGLEQLGIMVYPAGESDLIDAEAVTLDPGTGGLDIEMRMNFFDALFVMSSDTLRARSTFAHEIGHALLHESDVRAGRHRPHELSLRRAARANLRPFEDSEWQAHAFAGSLLVPVPALRLCGDRRPEAVAERFDVSDKFARSHLRRVRNMI
jgi:hypothetical protein